MKVSTSARISSLFVQAQEWAQKGLASDVKFEQEYCNWIALNRLSSAWTLKDQYAAERTAKRFAQRNQTSSLSAKVNATFGVDYKLESQEAWFDSAPAKQETDEEDALPNKAKYHHVQVWSTGKCQSKNKAKWNRSGRNARTLSNR